jgi:hypothetical protein
MNKNLRWYEQHIYYAYFYFLEKTIAKMNNLIVYSAHSYVYPGPG